MNLLPSGDTAANAAPTIAPGTPDGPDDGTRGSALAALRERIDRLEADARRLQSQLDNRA